MLVERLVRLNARYDSTRSRLVISGAVFLLACMTYLVHTHVCHSLTGPPPPTGDGVEYDSMAWELAQGRGFRIDLSESAFRQPYVDDPETSSVAAAWPREAYGETARRPPLYVVLLGAGNRAFGRQFWFGRVVNILCLSATCALLAGSVARLAGPVPALLAALQFVIVDWRTRFYGRELLTEALSVLLVALLAVLLIGMRNRPRLRIAAAAGAVYGLMLLTRSAFVLWIPVVGWLLWRSGRNDVARSRRALGRIGVFLLAAAVVAGAWWVRNCQVLARFAPFGTQGRMELSAGYSDIAFARGGMWSSLRADGFFEDVLDPGLSGLQQEQVIADESSRRARRWAAENFYKLPLLAAGKVFHELRPHGAGDLYVLAFAVLGLLALRGVPEQRILCGLIVACLFGIALTWSTSGRFLVPVLFPLHVAAGIGAWTALLGVTLDRPRAQARLRLNPGRDDASQG